MQAIADHVYHILIIAVVAATIVEAIVKVAKRPRTRRRTLNAPRESAAEREKRMQERYAAFGERWREWLDQPRGSGDTGRLVTAASIWGGPEQGASFPRRFHDAQLGKVTLDKRSYLAMLDAPANVVQPRRELAPTSWSDLRVDVWAVHSKAAQKPRLMRVWLSKDRALVELHRTRVVKVDEILPSEVVGFVRGFTRLGPRTGETDGLRWLPAEAMELGERPLWNTFRALRDISYVAPQTSPIGEALRASDYHAFAFVVSRREEGWKGACAHLRVLDCAGLTYQVGDAFSEVPDPDQWGPPVEESDPSCRAGDENGAGAPRSETNADGAEASPQAPGGGDARADRRGRGRPSRRRSLRSRRSAAEDAAVGAGQEVVEPELSELLDREPERLADTDLAVVPIDPREVLWAVEKMVEL